MREPDYIPYIIVLLFVVAVLFLLIGRRWIHTAMGRPSVAVGNGQTIGRRNEQDDYFSSISTSNGTLAVVADGISGLTNGRLASTVAVTTFVREFVSQDRITDLPAFFTQVARQANREILHQLRGARGGTTLVAAVVHHSRLYWGAVGDSTITVYRNRQFISLNRMHILEQELKLRCLAGEITREAAISHPMRKRLVNYLGFDGFKNLDVCTEPFLLQKGDKVILLSDGVYNTLSEVELEDILSRELSPFEAAEQMIHAIEQKGFKFQDNATVLILEQRH